MLKVMTLNTNYYVTKHGPWEARRELIADVIRQADPDIVALQSVRRDPAVGGGIDQAAQLAALVGGYDYVAYRPAAEHPGGIAEGSAVMARVEMGLVEHAPLSLRTGLDDTNYRILLHVRFDLPGGPLHLFNAHFSWVAEQAADNVNEALAFLGMIDGGPALLVGDFNQTPDATVLQPLAGAGWVDAWARLRPGEAGYTFESNNPTLRIDYAWANPVLAPALEGIEIVGREQDRNGYRVSDHHGLALTLALPA